MNKLLLKWIS